MQDLARRTCLNHYSREAVARCPECAQFYCRECVTEHDERVICASCLKKLAQGTLQNREKLGRLGRVGAAALGIITAWLFFYWTGQTLLMIPAKFHDGTVWTTSFLSE